MLDLVKIMWLTCYAAISIFIPQAGKEERFLDLCYDGTADIRDFSSLLAQEVEPDIYDEVSALHSNRQVSVLT